MNKVHKVKDLREHRLALPFGSGWNFEINHAAPAAGSRLAPDLADERYFRPVFVDHGARTWPNGYDRCSDVLRVWSEAGKVLDQAQTDAACAALFARSPGQSAA
jgi:hypothetical protein